MSFHAGDLLPDRASQSAAAALGPRAPERYLATGQMRPYDARGRPIEDPGALRQDGTLPWGRPWPIPRFQLEGEDERRRRELREHGEQATLVRDRLTGLQWLRNARPNDWPLSWAEALSRLRRLNRGARGPQHRFRLPNRRELRSLVSYAQRQPALPVGHPFRNVFGGPYWTSTTVAGKPHHAWTVRFDGGRMFFSHKQESCFFWPVRGEAVALPATGQRRCWDAHGNRLEDAADAACELQDGCERRGLQWPTPRFVGTASGAEELVVDRLTGLGWAPFYRLPSAPLSWCEALAAARRLADQRYGGRADWRLPTLNELESLVDADRWSPALPAEHGLGDAPPSCWSSTTSGYEPDWAMALYLDSGGVGVGQKSGRHHHGGAVCGRG
jgi:hypothetical protein